ncbi:SGNH/GDSL hydrolase family protein [Nocardioides ultimimeridianus]
MKRAALAALALAGGTVLAPIGTPAAHADGPGSGAPWVVSVGDSYISGEAGRWAGSSNSDSTRADALGSTAYYDNATNTGEVIARCHRSKSAEIYIGGGVSGLNLACSGAETSSYTDSSGNWKPGLDFANSGSNQGQALMLQSFASSHNVRMVAVSIGGNDFNFGSIVQDCVTDFLGSPSWWKDYCNDDSSVTSNFTSANVATVKSHIATALTNVRTAMRNAGYADSQWSMLVQTYPSPIPNGSGFRYSESGYTRQSTGGCGFWNNDANWANGTALPTINNTVTGAITQAGISNAKVLNLSSALNGRRLCESGVGLYEEMGVANWQTTGAVDKTEWVNQIRTVTTSGSSPYYIQESLHPNYWGQLAIRNCVRQAYNGGAVRGGTCNRTGNGLVGGEPVMTLQ